MPDELDKPVPGSLGSARQQIAVSSSWRGPLPPPEALRAYEQVFPGCAERIMLMAEAESKHRREVERQLTDTDSFAVRSEAGSERRGMWLAFVLAVLVIGLSGFLIYVDRLAWGVGLVSLELISLVGLFIYGRRYPGRRIADPESDPQQTLPFPGN